MEENNSIMKNDVWEIVRRPEGKSMVTSRWHYKVKHVADGSVEKYKAWFVARGFSQVEGVDYDETFAAVACYTSIISLISIAAQMGLKIHLMNPPTHLCHNGDHCSDRRKSSNWRKGLIIINSLYL